METQPPGKKNSTRAPAEASARSVSHQWEGVRDLSVWGKFCSEAVGRKEFVAVVVLDDVAHRLQRHRVHVQLVRIHVVQRGWLRWVACGETVPLLAVAPHANSHPNPRDFDLRPCRVCLSNFPVLMHTHVVSDTLSHATASSMPQRCG